MADMPAYERDNNVDDDAFADELAGNLYPNRSAGTPPRGLYGVAHKQFYGLAEGGKAELVRNIGTIANMVREIAGQVEGFGVEPFAGYARQASGIVSDIHTSFAEKSIDALIDDGRDLVRQRPEIAIVAAVAIGFIGARLLKARS